jgi:hypothetical protein
MDTEVLEQVVAPPTDGAAPASAEQAASDAFLLTFKTKEEAEKGFKHFQAEATKAQQRAAELEKQSEQYRLQAEVARQLNEEAKSRAQDSGESVASERAKLEEDYARMLIGDNPGKAFTDMGERYLSVAQRRIEALEKKMMAELEKHRGSIAEVRVTQSDTYKQNKQAIDELAESFGVPTSKAVEVFESMAKKMSFVPIGAPPPGGTATSRPSGGSGNDTAKWRALTPAEWQYAKNMGLDEKDISKTDGEGHYI